MRRTRRCSYSPGPVAAALVFLLLTATAGLAQQQQKFPSDFWNAGKIVLENGDTVKGQLKYSMQNDLVQVQAQGRLETYTPRKAVYFEIFDQLFKRYRQFYSMPYAEDGQYKAPVFFELLEEGKMTLLYRENLEYKTYSSAYYYGSYTRLVLANKYFFLKDNGIITPFTGKNKGDLLDLMGTRAGDVKKFSKEQKLNFDYKYDVASMVRYYNSLH